MKNLWKTFLALVCLVSVFVISFAATPAPVGFPGCSEGTSGTTPGYPWTLSRIESSCGEKYVVDDYHWDPISQSWKPLVHRHCCTIDDYFYTDNAYPFPTIQSWKIVTQGSPDKVDNFCNNHDGLLNPTPEGWIAKYAHTGMTPHYQCAYTPPSEDPPARK